MILKFGKWPIFYKIMMAIIIIVVLTLGIVTLVQVGVLRARMREQIGGKIVNLAAGRMGYIADTLAGQLALLQGIALDNTLIGAVETANAGYTGDASAIERALIESNRRWLIATDDSALVQAQVNPSLNPTAAQLLVYAKKFPAYGEFFITDRYGGLVAATGRLPYYYQINEVWWQTAYNGGRGAFYISQPAYNQRTGYIALTMAAPILSPADGTVIGLLRSTLNMNILSTAFETLALGQTGAATLTDEQRVILADSDPLRIGKSVPASWRLYTVKPGVMWAEESSEAGEKLIIGRAALTDAMIADEQIAAAIRKLNWYLFIYQAQTEAYTRIAGGVWTGVSVSMLLLVLAAVAAWLLARTLSTPVVQMLAAMRSLLAGDQTQRAWVYWPDETGALAESLNTMADNSQEMSQALSGRAAEREREQKRRARDLDASTAVGEVISATADVPALGQRVVDLLRERFGLYYVGLFLLDDAGQWLVLHAGAGDPSASMLAKDYRVSLGQWVVGRCITENRTYLARDTDADSALWFDRSQLLYTRAAIALPLRSRGQVFGAIEAHGYQIDSFDSESAIVLQTIADQVAVAIDGLRLFAERQEAMESLRRAYGEATREAWQSLLAGRAAGSEGYQAETRRVVPLPAADPATWRPAVRRAWTEGRVVLDESAAGNVEPSLALPIRLRDEVIGVVDVSKRGDAGAWKPDEIAQLEQLVGQLGLTLEISRFYQESQRAAAREQLLREVSERVRVAVDVDSVMRIAAQEIGDVLKRPVFVYLANEAASQTAPETGEH